MKFSPETLLQIYLDGSFTEEAQAEFDKLMRHDPVFAEKVTGAVAERLGPIPEASMSAIALNLDAKVQDLWVNHKPSPWRGTLKLGLKTLAAMSIAAAGYWGFHHWFRVNGASPLPSNLRSQVDADNPSTVKNPSDQSLPVTKSAVKPAKKNHAKTQVQPEEAATNDGTETNLKGEEAPAPSRVGAGNGVQIAAPAVEDPAPIQDKGAMTSAEGDALRVAIHSDKTGQATITVFDSNGVLVRHLFQGPVQAGDRYVDWDGRNDLGAPVVPGAYNVVLDLDGKKMSGVLKILPK